MSVIEGAKYKKSVGEFRKKHKCKLCPYYEIPRQCDGKLHCLLEQEAKEREQRDFKEPCPHDKIGGYMYGNESGTCFGFCLQRILEEKKQGY